MATGFEAWAGVFFLAGHWFGMGGGKKLEEKGQEIYDLFLSVASGTHSKSEAQGLGDFEFVPWQIGATM